MNAYNYQNPSQFDVVIAETEKGSLFVCPNISWIKQWHVSFDNMASMVTYGHSRFSTAFFLGGDYAPYFM